MAIDDDPIACPPLQIFVNPGLSLIGADVDSLFPMAQRDAFRHQRDLRLRHAMGRVRASFRFVVPRAGEELAVRPEATLESAVFHRLVALVAGV
ncbi:hypothetical protein D3C76_1219440 [compost metagenome]